MNWTQNQTVAAIIGGIFLIAAAIVPFLLSNNQFRKSATIANQLFRIDSVTFTPSNPIIGDSIYFNFFIENLSDKKIDVHVTLNNEKTSWGKTKKILFAPKERRPFAYKIYASPSNINSYLENNPFTFKIQVTKGNIVLIEYLLKPFTVQKKIRQ